MMRKFFEDEPKFLSYEWLNQEKCFLAVQVFLFIFCLQKKNKENYLAVKTFPSVWLDAKLAVTWFITVMR